MFNQFQASNSMSSSTDTNKQQEDACSSLSSGGTASPPPHSDNEATCYSLATSRPKKRAGRRVFKETRHPVYRGVRKRNGDKWVCEMRDPKHNNTRVWLGTYPTTEMAARAHDVAALAFKGKSACLNFTDSAWRLPAPASLDPKVIRKAANEAAQMFQPRLIDQPESVSASGCSRCEESIGNGSTGEAYLDEEALLEMPRLLADMAQGLLYLLPISTRMIWRIWIMGRVSLTIFHCGVTRLGFLTA